MRGLIAVIAFLSLVLLTDSASAQVDACTLVSNGAYQDITAHGECRRVTNNSGATVCAATGTAAMWGPGANSFISSPPAGVTVASCPSACGTGMYSYGGYCYLTAFAGNSCDAACTNYGGCHLTGTRAIGSAGTDGACQAVMTGLGYSHTWGGNGTTAATGCTYYSDKYGTTLYRWTTTTTCAATYSGYGRVCACNSAGASCTLPWGGTIAHGASVTAYGSGCAGSCPSETRTCTDGTLSGSYTLQSCGGFMDGGYCYVGGTVNGQSCDTVCSARGGCNLNGTRRIGSGSAPASCLTVLDGLSLGTGSVGTVTGAFGCSVASTTRRRATSTTTCAATNASYRRVCACTAGTTAVDGVCGSPNECISGTPANQSSQFYNCPGIYGFVQTWDCVGSGGGSTASCSSGGEACCGGSPC